MERSLFADAENWAEANFRGVELGRSDRTGRLIHSAARIAVCPEASFPAAFERKDLRCFYSLMHRPEATHDALLKEHFALTKKAMVQSDDVTLVVHDTTELDFTSHQ